MYFRLWELIWTILGLFQGFWTGSWPFWDFSETFITQRKKGTETVPLGALTVHNMVPLGVLFWSPSDRMALFHKHDYLGKRVPLFVHIYINIASTHKWEPIVKKHKCAKKLCFLKYLYLSIWAMDPGNEHTWALGIHGHHPIWYIENKENIENLYFDT